MTSERRRVLVSAFAFSPYHGSESGIGWNVVTRLAAYHDVTVLVGDLREDQQTKWELDQWLAENGQISGLTVRHVSPDRRIEGGEKLHRLPGLWPLYYLAYNLWQRKAFQTALQLHRENPFQACHQFTILSYREPGYLW